MKNQMFYFLTKKFAILAALYRRCQQAWSIYWLSLSLGLSPFCKMDGRVCVYIQGERESEKMVGCNAIWWPALYLYGRVISWHTTSSRVFSTIYGWSHTQTPTIDFLAKDSRLLNKFSTSCGSCPNQRWRLTKVASQLRHNFYFFFGIHRFCFIRQKEEKKIIEEERWVNVVRFQLSRYFPRPLSACLLFSGF